MAPSRLLLALTLLLVVAPTATATQVVPLDDRGLVRSSQEIVIGQVQTVRSYWDAKHTRILTDVTLDVSETLKGSATPTLTVTQMGGEVDGMKLEIEGTPAFRPGREALLFVWRDPQGRAQVNGLAQGKFDVETDAATGERFVTRSAEGLALRDARTAGAIGAERSASRMRLSDFKRYLQGLIEEEAGR